MGVLGWSPSEFWEASLYDMIPALDGFAEKNGAKSKEKQPAHGPEGLRAFLGNRARNAKR